MPGSKAAVRTGGDRRTLELPPSLDAESERVPGPGKHSGRQRLSESRNGRIEKLAEVKREAGRRTVRRGGGATGLGEGAGGGTRQPLNLGDQGQGVSPSRAETAKMQVLATKLPPCSRVATWPHPWEKACFEGLSHARARPRGLGRPRLGTPSPHAVASSKEPNSREERRWLSPGRWPDSHPPDRGDGPWKTRPRHPLPSRQPLGPHGAPGRSAAARNADPRWRAPPGPRPPHSRSPSPAAVATSDSRGFCGRGSPPGLPSLTSFPVRAGAVGRWWNGRDRLRERARPGPALPAAAPPTSAPGGGAARTRKKSNGARRGGI